MELCPSIKNVLLLDSERKRIAVKYYSDDWPTNSAKEALKKLCLPKTRRLMLEPKVKMKMRSSWPQYSRVFFDAVGFLLRGNEDKKEGIGELGSYSVVP
ncbi:hypothetical protein F3Y22_tig00110332pilonHSYRG00853 [Hibiscus syriacus]|uniref:Coatomer subunit zeta n=1 Tax=Hibiscus syriacus TaxID=106335 RepID=A0A6A3AXB2_HIBSY|nr:hypothetical protein F3Y22_tig00110332pilonHSYRG00853 [Hibiscus syriacus]